MVELPVVDETISLPLIFLTLIWMLSMFQEVLAELLLSGEDQMLPNLCKIVR